MSPIFVIIAVFVGVTALVIAIAVMMRGDSDAQVDKRLSMLTGKNGAGDAGLMQDSNLLMSSLDSGTSALEKFMDRFFNLSRIFEQADVNMTVPKFASACGICGGIGFVIGLVAGVKPAFAPIAAASMAFLPFFWLLFKRKRRMKAFAAQLPQALELIARALRAGHSLAAGFNLVCSEMSAPIAKEFGRVFEEQNLGIPLEEALLGMTERIPNLDLKFFATAIVLQRQTGGDLAEILDKIGRLIRERFQIWGQVQALTGEGRLSGIVLLALPPALFVAVYRLNPEYMMVLFSDELGKKMLIGGVVMQLFGALVIRKIVNIRV